MKKICLGFLLLLLVLLGISILAWGNRTSMAEWFLRNRLNVPVHMDSLNLTKQQLSIDRLLIRNPASYRTSTAFSAGSIEVTSTLDQLREDPLVIEEITMTNLLINIETDADGHTNWDHILSHSTKPPSKPRHYLIKKITLQNLSVQTVQPNGRIKQYPMIERIEFSNISDTSGFPVEEIEKAIFDKMIQDLYQKLDLQKILQPFLPKTPFFKGGLPLQQFLPK